VRPGTLLRLAVAGTRTDTVRIALTGLGAVLGALALLSAATVLAIPTVPDPSGGVPMAPYSNALLREPGLRPGLAFALILLTVPVLLFVGQCARLGAPARDRRLAALRLAGATPGQGVAIATAESGVATFVGTTVGLLIYLVGRRLLDAPDNRGVRPLPTDVLPPWWALAAIVLGLPLVATAVTAMLLRRVAVGPLGVARRARNGAPKPWPGALIVVGVAAFPLLEPVGRLATRQGWYLAAWVVPLVLFGGGLAATVGVVTGTGWISYTAGRLLSRYARRPAALLAGRRLQADPWSGSRALAALLAAVIFAAGAAWFTSSIRTEQLVQDRQQHALNASAGIPDDPSYYWHDPFYLRAMQLVGYAVLVAGLIAAGGLAVTVVTSIVDRRRALASLTASGVPRAVLGRAILWQSLAVALPAVVLAIATGLALGRGIAEPTVGRGVMEMSQCIPPLTQPEVCQSPDPATYGPYLFRGSAPAIRLTVPVPWSELGVIGGWALAATALTGCLGLLFLRASTAPEELRTG
jgi:hypothetical protein